MKSKVPQANLWRIYLLIFGSCSVIATNFLDPVNWPKQIAVLAVLPIVIREVVKIDGFNSRFTLRLAWICIVPAILFTASVLIHDTSLTRILWGAFGRNNGLVTLLSLLMICFLTGLTSQIPGSSNIMMRSLSLAFLPATGYGLIQLVGLDPVNWSVKGQLFSFFGNPNFAASIFAMVSIASAYSSLTSSNKNLRLLFALYSLTSALLSYSTKSIQGIVLIGFAIILTCFFFFQKRIPNRAKPILILTPLSLGLFVLLGFFGQGPLGSFLFQYTLRLRQFYWQTGLRIGESNNLLGVGIDSFGDHYRSFRTLEIAQTTSVDLVVDNAHNSLIQIFATLGLGGLIAYFTVLIPSLWALIRSLFVRDSEKSQWCLSILFFSAFTTSLISIDNIAVAVLNWALMGYFLGKFVGKQDNSNLSRQDKFYERKLSRTSEALFPLVTWSLTFMLFFLSWFSSSADRELLKIFNTPTTSTNQSELDSRWKSLFNVAQQEYGLQEAHFRYISDGIRSAKNDLIALEATKLGINKFPLDFLLLDRAAVTSESMGKFLDAKRYRELQLKIDPRHSKIWLYLARNQIELGDLSAARSSIETAKSFEILLDDEGKEYMRNLEARLVP